jgi:hypothetical protein
MHHRRRGRWGDRGRRLGMRRAGAEDCGGGGEHQQVQTAYATPMEKGHLEAPGVFRRSSTRGAMYHAMIWWKSISCRDIAKMPSAELRRTMRTIFIAIAMALAGASTAAASQATPENTQTSVVEFMGARLGMGLAEWKALAHPGRNPDQVQTLCSNDSSGTVGGRLGVGAPGQAGQTVVCTYTSRLGSISLPLSIPLTKTTLCETRSTTSLAAGFRESSSGHRSTPSTTLRPASRPGMGPPIKPCATTWRRGAALICQECVRSGASPAGRLRLSTPRHPRRSLTFNSPGVEPPCAEAATPLYLSLAGGAELK